MMLWVNNDANPRWERISYDDTMEEALNKPNGTSTGKVYVPYCFESGPES